MIHNYTAPLGALTFALLFGFMLATTHQTTATIPASERERPTEPTITSALAAISAAAQHQDLQLQRQSAQAATFRLITALGHTGRCVKQRGWLLAKISTNTMANAAQVKEWVALAKARGCASLISLPWTPTIAASNKTSDK